MQSADTSLYHSTNYFWAAIDFVISSFRITPLAVSVHGYHNSTVSMSTAPSSRAVQSLRFQKDVGIPGRRLSFPHDRLAAGKHMQQHVPEGISTNNACKPQKGSSFIAAAKI